MFNNLSPEKSFALAVLFFFIGGVIGGEAQLPLIIVGCLNLFISVALSLIKK